MSKKIIVVGVGDMKLSKDPDSVVATYSLGSCIGLVVYDPEVKVGGILHYMLPNSKIDGESTTRPFMFANTGIPILFREIYKMGAKKSRLIVKAAGGSTIMDDRGIFGIGKKNYMALKDIFARNNVNMKGENVGGNISRTIYLNIRSGEVVIKTSGEKQDILL